jgi:uncharacterized protein (TIGR02246 family)
MKKFLLIKILIIISIFVSKISCSNVNSIDQTSVSENQILELFAKWNDAIMTKNPDEVVKLYAEDAILLPTLSNKVRTNHNEIKDYFIHFLELKPKGKINENYIRIHDNIAINSGIYTFTIAHNGEDMDVGARFTYVYKYINNQWLIIEHHSSVLPE